MSYRQLGWFWQSSDDAGCGPGDSPNWLGPGCSGKGNLPSVSTTQEECAARGGKWSDLLKSCYGSCPASTPYEVPGDAFSSAGVQLSTCTKNFCESGYEPAYAPNTGCVPCKASGCRDGSGKKTQPVTTSPPVAIDKPPAPSPVPEQSSFPWGWIIGAGIVGGVIYLATKRP